jgi:hypothetical protein
MSTFRYFHQRAFTSDWNGVTFRFGTPWVQGQFLNGFGNFYREKLPWQGNEQIPWPGYLFLQKASIQLIAADSDFTSSSTTALARWRGDQDGLSATFKFNWLGASLTYANVRGAKGEFLCANEKISAHDGFTPTGTACRLANCSARPIGCAAIYVSRLQRSPVLSRRYLGLRPRLL